MRLVRLRQSTRRSWSRLSISNQASRWLPKVPGWAVCRGVKPGMMVSASRSACSSRPCCRRGISPRIRSISSRSHRRISVAPWSFRQVPVFQAAAPVELAGFDFRLDLLEAVDDAVALGIAEYADFGQHGGVGDGAHDVVAIQALVEFHGSGKAGDKGIDGFAEAAAPGLIGFFSAHGLHSAGALKRAGCPAASKAENCADNNRLKGKIAALLRRRDPRPGSVACVTV